ncbi:unnamed protein product [Hermetia illucens]|uniref:Odorant receptor n=1 Tax=Hermetia illucens TaxID=343691 RepID=A0A7R8YVY8_HERIL|nr:odorant receptor 19a-like [Hermetia illucens]CAD7086809.1 unnamed protein product [Hermetia illucens]
MLRTSDLLGHHISVFNFFGVWRSKDKVKDLQFSIRSFIFIYCIGPLIVASIFAAGLHQTDFTDTIISPLYTANIILIFLKILNVYIKTQKIEDFLDQMDKVPFFPEAGEKDTKHSTVQKVRFLPIILAVLFISVSLVVLFAPVVLGKMTTARSIPTWYPFEWEGKFGLCFVLFIFEFVVAVTFATLVVTTDTFLACVLLIIGGQFESLGYRFKDLPKNNATIWRTKFKTYIQDYNSICKLCKEFEDIFSGIILIQALCSCLLICLSAFGLGLAHDIETFLRFLTFLLCMLYEVFLTCYAGDYVADKSKKLLFDLYSSSWPDIPQDCRKMLLIFSMKLNNPIIIKFGIIQNLHLRTFTKVVDGAYKLYALLQQVPE